MALRAGCAKDPEGDAPKPVVDAPPSVVDFEKLEERDGLLYLLNKEKLFTGIAVSKYDTGQKMVEETWKDGNWAFW